MLDVYKQCVSHYSRLEVRMQKGHMQLICTGMGKPGAQQSMELQSVTNLKLVTKQNRPVDGLCVIACS